MPDNKVGKVKGNGEQKKDSTTSSRIYEEYTLLLWPIHLIDG